MATKANIVIDAGTTFSTDLNLTDQNGDPLNLTGYTANSQMRRWYTSSNSVTFTTSINASSGVVTLFLDANTTSTIWPGRYVYDVDINNGTTISRVVEGIVTVTPAVTR
jgi:hypothetical protein